MNKRNSSVELLRIVMTLLIICLHYSIQCGMSDGLFTSSNFTFSRYFIQCASMFGRLACSVFVLISGYYGIESRLSLETAVVKDAKIFCKLVAYSYAILLVAMLSRLPIDRTTTLKACFPFLFDMWFVKYYMVFLLFTPILNAFLNSLKKRQFQIFCVLMLFVWSVVPTVSINAWEFSDLDFMIIFYCLGAYIKRFVNISSKRLTTLTNIIAPMSVFALFLSVLVFDLLGVYFRKDILISKATWFKNYNSVLAVICAVSFFLLAIERVFYSKIVNSIAKSCLWIYVLHDHIIIREIWWNRVSPNIQHVDFPYIHMPLKVLMTFALCLAVDAVYSHTIERYLNLRIERLSIRVIGFIKSLRSRRITDEN